MSSHLSLPCLCRLLLLAVVLCSWTCRSYEVANTWIWRLRAGHRSAKQAMGVSGACAGCWWVQRRQTGHFLRHAADGRQERQGRGERELPRTEGDARATSQAKTSSCTPSIRRSATPFTTSASSSAPSRSRSPRAWRSWPICWVQLKMPCLAPSHPPPASACSDHTHSSPCRSTPCPRRPETRANHLRWSVSHAELQRGRPRQDCHQAQATRPG